MDKIAVGIAVVAAAKAERKREDDEQARRYEEQRQRRELEARLKYIEDRRCTELEKLVAAHQRVEQLQSLLACVGARPTEHQSTQLTTFRSWLIGQVEDARSLLTADRLEEYFTTENVFGSDDDRDFSTGRW